MISLLLVAVKRRKTDSCPARRLLDGRVSGCSSFRVKVTIDYMIYSFRIQGSWNCRFQNQRVVLRFKNQG
ncbi:unnamed protein product [Musa acuminata subsp. malaccensis]|uniref:Uncharacterized protein n=1 Tax=Musa acuminata subsp. malaccensis TaxID=214687 RepID=A0A804U5R2_MUSAM|nr:unnamed protein product [Musa acuminata subsp. malaccensis]